ncbi:MAG: DUF881 domain-containing protein [Schwartzia sp. (in: firmicutes)]
MITLKHGHISVVFVCMVLGFMLATQFRIAMDQRSSLPYQRQEELAARLLATEKERDALQEKLADLEATAAQAAKNAVERQAIDDLRLRAGQIPLTGPGVIVTIDDSKTASKAGDNQNLYIIHDDDLLRVVNELRAAGAEALSINGQRLMAMSEIRCAGPTLSVNNVRSAPPYEIRAIGNVETLEKALLMRGGVADTLQVWGIQIDIKTAAQVTVPAYKGMGPMQYARPQEEAAS